MNESFVQQLAQTPAPETGARQATHRVGSAMSSASREVDANAVRQAANAPRKRLASVRGGTTSGIEASIGRG